jgi:hypothetical protein
LNLVTGNSKTIENAFLGIVVDAPASWNPQSGSPNSALRLSNVAIPSEEGESSTQSQAFFEISLRQGANGTRMPIDTWFDQRFGGRSDIVTKAGISVGGLPATRIQTEELGNSVHVYVALGQDIVEITFGEANVSLLSEYERMLATLRFTR